jgi:hypothetical protein
MEGVAGLELGRTPRELKRRQRNAVEHDVVARTLVPQLQSVAECPRMRPIPHHGQRVAGSGDSSAR